MEPKEKFEGLVNSYMEALSNAIYSKDFFGYAKALGVLEYLGMPDIEFHTAFAFHMTEDFEKAAELFLKVPEQSAEHPMAMQCLATDYMCLGDYLALDSVLSKNADAYSPLEELSLRIQCLEHSETSYLHDHQQDIKAVEARIVASKEYEGDEAKCFFNICRALTVGLVATGECINQCSLYQRRTGKEFSEFANAPEVKRFMEEYEKWCLVLNLSKYLQIFKLPDGIESLAVCALSDITWEQKLVIFQSSNYVKQIMQIILTLCRPEVHKNIAPYEAVDQILEAYLHIAPPSLAQTVNHYFEIVSRGYLDGASTAAQYLGYVYSEILATGRDPFGLKIRIDALRKQDDNVDFGAGAPRIKLVRSMSRNGYDAYINAQDSFAKTQNIVQGSRDYSALSLQFFRVLEIEYCEKLITPLSKMIDIDTALDLADQSDEEWKCKSWKYDIKCLEKIKNGDQKSFEVGAIRTMLGHIVGWKTQNDPCAEYLRPLIENLLTNEGKNALHNKEMLNVIGNAELEKYRIPGAHTGFLPYSTACESKEYVEENLQKVVSWFK